MDDDDDDDDDVDVHEVDIRHRIYSINCSIQLTQCGQFIRRWKTEKWEEAENVRNYQHQTQAADIESKTELKIKKKIWGKNRMKKKHS